MKNIPKRKCIDCGNEFKPRSGTHIRCGIWNVKGSGCAFKNKRSKQKAWIPTKRYLERKVEYHRKEKQRRLRIRFEVMKRDLFQCRYCGRKPPEVSLQIDHLFPKSKGGENRIENYITACMECNIGKGDKILTEFI